MTTTKRLGKDFILVVLGQIISLFGNAMLRFALPLYLLKETNSPALFGLVTACSFLPMIVLSFMGGILADRVSKRNIMVILDAITGIIVVFLLLFLGKLSIVPLFIVVLMLLYGISGAYQPAVQASIPVLVSKDNILVACAIINQVNALSGLLGPIIGGILFGAFGLVPILFICSICFFFSALMELFIKIPMEKRNNPMGIISIIKNDFHDSIHYILREKPMLVKIIMVIAGFNLVLSAMIMVGTPILIVETLQMPVEFLGVSQGVLGLGGLCGGIFTAFFHKKLSLSKTYILLILAACSVGIIALPFFFQAANMLCYIVITVALFIVMVLSTMFSVTMLATVQKETPSHLVGKVIALMMSLSMCAQPLGQGIYGLVFEWFSSFTSVAVILSIAALFSILIGISAKNIYKVTD